MIKIDGFLIQPLGELDVDNFAYSPSAQVADSMLPAPSSPVPLSWDHGLFLAISPYSSRTYQARRWGWSADQRQAFPTNTSAQKAAKQNEHLKKGIANSCVQKRKGSTFQGHILELCFSDDLRGKRRKIKSVQADTNKQHSSVT